MPKNLAKDELKAVIQWDVTNWKKALNFWNKHLKIEPGMKVLALGEREGGLSYYFAKLGCQVVCSDYNDFPDTTKNFHLNAGLADHISYQQIDMRAIEFSDEEFDIVVFKSVIGALGNKEDQDQSVEEIHRVLKTGGVFLYAENARGSKALQTLRKKMVDWGERWRYITAGDIDHWSDHFTKSYMKSYGSLDVFGRSEKQRSFLGSLDTVFSPITPKSWRYIFFGVMFK
jgi:ubiquinone/menaquinone biosynthesis C-methylase UbiE